MLTVVCRGKFYVQRRTTIKDYCPGMLDPMAGGVVQIGEPMEENAAREAEEEMGVRGVPLTPVASFYYDDARSRVFGGLFECTFDGPLRLQPEEVDEVLEMSADEILARRDEFTPDGIHAFEIYLRHRGGGTN
jgi:8-oxo-dGTP pyrophosphatase MutT (NUDIX family)